MKYFSVLFCSIFLVSISGFAQNKIDKYVVGKGETINQIAQKFKITPFDIYKLNPDAQNGLKPNSVLLIPRNSVKSNVNSPKTSKVEAKTHEVLAKETLFGIEKKYDVTDEALKKANPDLEKNGLQVGQILNIPSKNGSKTTTVSKNATVFHTVLPKETKYSIAKQYDITIEELEKTMIREGLKRTNWNKSRLAKELGISRAGLIMKVEKYGLDKRKLARLAAAAGNTESGEA